MTNPELPQSSEPLENLPEDWIHPSTRALYDLLLEHGAGIKQLEDGLVLVTCKLDSVVSGLEARIAVPAEPSQLSESVGLVYYQQAGDFHIIKIVEDGTHEHGRGDLTEDTDFDQIFLTKRETITRSDLEEFQEVLDELRDFGVARN